MALNPPENDQNPCGHDTVNQRIDSILAGLRVPELPYPVGQVSPDQCSDWRPLLLSWWQDQQDQSVTQLMRALSVTWTVRQVNAAYISDRIMDVFLRTSGLHPVLIRRIARLRFFLAWRMAQDGSVAVESSIRAWLDSLTDWRGWSDSSGRSSRALLDQLDVLVTVVTDSLHANNLEPFEQYALQWSDESAKRHQRSDRLHQRLLTTEQGAARQRWSEQTARAFVGRALSGRRLPPPITQFILDHWLPLLRQIVWNTGREGDDWRHASKLLEWLVWIGDSSLSGKDHDRLYQVGEQLGDRINDVWSRVQGQPLPQDALKGVESVMMARLRGDSPERAPAISADLPFAYDTHWLATGHVDVGQLALARSNWYVEGEGAKEQRMFFLDLLGDSQDILWTNGFGVKLALMPWSEFVQAQTQGRLKPLPPLNEFGAVLADTVAALGAVLDSQHRQRQKAASEARARADLLRQQKEAAERKSQQEEMARIADLERQRIEEEAQRVADEEALNERIEREKTAAAMTQVDNIKLGGWIALDSQAAASSDGGAATSVRLKLAIRINASRKLIFVDRLGLNRTEYTIDELTRLVAAGDIRVLSSAAEFDDTLSRVVGRIRVGRI